ncbi:MAG: hypothetical protein ACHQU0_03565 [Candidatus Paceibacteria bacterium]
MRPAIKVEVRNGERAHRVWIVRGCQWFRLDYAGTKQECEWYADQLRYALGLISKKEHDKRVKRDAGAAGLLRLIADKVEANGEPFHK